MSATSIASSESSHSPTSTLHPHPTPSYRIAMTSGAGTAPVGAPAEKTNTTSRLSSPRCSVVNSLPEGLLRPPAQRPARYSLPPKLAEPPAQAILSNARASLPPPPPPPSPALRRRAAVLFYGIVAQFFLSIGCLFSVVATTITVFSFGLECLFNISNNAALSLVTVACIIVLAQLITSSMGVGAFEGKKQIDIKIHLLIAYFILTITNMFTDAALLCLTATAGALSLIDEYDCAMEAKGRRYYSSIISACLFLVFASLVLLHLIISIGISMLLCWTSDLFIQRNLFSAVTTTTTTTNIAIKEHLTAAAPPVKRFT